MATMSAKERILGKVLSGRWYTTNLLVTTYCMLPFAMLLLVYLDKMKVDFVQGYIAGLGSTVLIVIKFYYDRERNGNGKPPSA